MATAIIAASAGDGPKAREWHRKPAGDEEKRCPICSAPAKLSSEHQLILDGEGGRRRYICRKKTPGGWMEWIYGSRSQRRMVKGPDAPKGPKAPTEKTLQRISRAAAMLADGATMRTIAADLETSQVALQSIKQAHPELWRSAVNRAMSAMAAIVEAQAGSVEVLADPAAYVAKALAAERWASRTGRPFIPVVAGTLRAFYESYYRSTCVNGLCTHEIEMLQRTVRLWAVLTGDPPLQSITAETLATFRDCIGKLPGKRRPARMRPATVFSYMKRIQCILDKAGPPMRGNRDAAGILDRVPWIKPPRIFLDEPRTVSDELLNQLYLGLVAAEKPSGFRFKPSAWWRALIVLALNTGLRRGTLFKIEMAHVDWQKRRLWIPAKNNKSRKAFAVHLNETAFGHLLRIRGERELLFPWPHDIHHFHACFHKLQTAAGIPRADHFGLHNLRKTLATKLYEQNSPGAAQLALGHSAIATTERHYVASSGIVATALDLLPQPAAFAAAITESEAVT